MSAEQKEPNIWGDDYKQQLINAKIEERTELRRVWERFNAAAPPAAPLLAIMDAPSASAAPAPVMCEWADQLWADLNL